ncbi:hypothetical protein E2C01_020074 [Portunus trituberculatus]|uniref:Uncharacterized protein n=1 Tax=Portunus trituberculatus TaxID=210409 RepID=A0A5B7E144_PORTR|nr:hypothetical protein [Portunus trituberculatus]
MKDYITALRGGMRHSYYTGTLSIQKITQPRKPPTYMYLVVLPEEIIKHGEVAKGTTTELAGRRAASLGCERPLQDTVSLLRGGVYKGQRGRSCLHRKISDTCENH